jgi:arylsulfatase A-like enzyme
MIRTESWKYIHRTEGFASELYDLASDPGERNNLNGDPAYQQQREGLQAHMDAWFASLGCGDPDLWKNAKQKVLPSYERVDR